MPYHCISCSPVLRHHVTRSSTHISSRRFPISACVPDAASFVSSRISNAPLEFSSFETAQSQPCLKHFVSCSSQVLSRLPARSVVLVRVYSCGNTELHKCAIRASHSSPTLAKFHHSQGSTCFRFMIDTSLQGVEIIHRIHGPNPGPTSSESHIFQTLRLTFKRTFTVQEFRIQGLSPYDLL
jgi:hypothetical protein